VRRTEYVPYNAAFENEGLRRLLREIEVSEVRAIYWTCTPQWKMSSRRIGDDMLFYVVHGQGEAQIEGKTVALERGVCLHCRRGVEHGAATNPRDPLVVITVHYTATVWQSLTVPELLDFPASFLLHPEGPLAKILEEACREYELQPAGWKPGLQALVLRFLLQLLREGHIPLITRTDVGTINDLQRLLPALETMRHDLALPISIPELALQCSLSPAQFRRIFRRALNASPIEHLRRLRIEAACALLRGTDQTVGTIAEKVGYADRAFFTHTFHDVMGMPPGRYRSLEVF
jgi:AraC-like DNA-binding protein/quercetin dioxygenase-like cupin family protein